MTTTFKYIVHGKSANIQTIAFIALVTIGICQSIDLGALNQRLFMSIDIPSISGATQANATESLDTYTNFKAD